MDKFLAVFGGNQMACPAICRLRERGHRVLVVDGNPNAPAKSFCDRFIHSNFSDVEATIESLKEFELSGAMPLNDFAVSAASRTARERNLRGWGTQAERC